MDPNFFMHETDQKALATLKAIPGFAQLFKVFIKNWGEQQYRILNMSTNLRISEKQLPRYYDLLPPICERLGIDIPELYLKLDVRANAYTAGDTKPFIVMTTGLLETLPDELIPTVLAHECGHIACHHCLYTTMGRMILNDMMGVLGTFGLKELVSYPIKVAFSYWMRCSELSADRAAALCDGSADNTVSVCMHLAGFDKDIAGQAQTDVFMQQAQEYLQMIRDSKWSKALEFMLLSGEEHPLNAVRAYECAQWAKTERFEKLVRYLDQADTLRDEEIVSCLREIPMPASAKAFLGKDVAEAQKYLQSLGFIHVQAAKVTQKDKPVKVRQVVNIHINGKEGFELCEWFPVDAEIVLEYYEPETEEEVLAAHPGQARMPNGYKYCIGRPYKEIIECLSAAGFTQIEAEERRRAKRGLRSRQEETISVSVNGQTQFEKGEWFDKNAAIQIVYCTYPEKPKA